MLKAFFRFLNKDITGRTWQAESSHPYFGDMVLFAFRDSDASYWEAEIDCEGQPITVHIDAPDRREPSDSHVQFAQQIVSAPEHAFAQAAPLLAPEFERWHAKPLPTDWRTALRFTGFTVPVDGDGRNEWELSYESLWESRPHLTCRFVGGKPESVTIDT